MKMIKALTIFLLFGSLQSGLALNKTDAEKINSIIYGYVDAWNIHAGRGFADNFSYESDFINIFGMHFHGKEDIQKRHNEILDTFLKGSVFTITNMEFREVKPDLVMAFVRWRVDGFHKPGTDLSGPGETIRGIFSHVMINDEGEWKVASTQNTLSK